MNRPPPGSMVYWRFKTPQPTAYRFGYCTYVSSYNMIQLGHYSGDTIGGPIVDVNEIEWKSYR